MMMWILCILLLPLLYRPLLRLLTPRAIPGIPAWPNPSPILGDIPRIAKCFKETGGFSRFMDQCAMELGVISQIRLGFFHT